MPCHTASQWCSFLQPDLANLLTAPSYPSWLQVTDTPYIPFSQEEAVGEQSQHSRRSLVSLLGMGDKKDKRRMSASNDAAPEAPVYVPCSWCLLAG